MSENNINLNFIHKYSLMIISLVLIEVLHLFISNNCPIKILKSISLKNNVFEIY